MHSLFDILLSELLKFPILVLAINHSIIGILYIASLIAFTKRNDIAYICLTQLLFFIQPGLFVTSVIPYFYLFKNMQNTRQVIEKLMIILICTIMIYIFWYVTFGYVTIVNNFSYIANYKLIGEDNLLIFILPIITITILLKYTQIFWASKIDAIRFTALVLAVYIVFDPSNLIWCILYVSTILSYELKSITKNRLNLILCIPVLFLSMLSFFLYSEDQFFLLGYQHQIGRVQISLINLLSFAVIVFQVRSTFKRRSDLNLFSDLANYPLCIGISGDSGVGKDHLVGTIIDGLGSKSVVHVSGDDYHLGDRQSGIWKTLTHLNPLANDLQKFGHDIVALKQGDSIRQAHYDHATGTFAEQVVNHSKPFIIASGLHTHFLSTTRSSLDLKIHLLMDEELRTFFKVKRDHFIRGHSIETIMASIERRRDDKEKYIDVQQKEADLIFKVKAGEEIKSYSKNCAITKFNLSITSRSNELDLRIYRILVGLVGLHCNFELIDENQSVFHIEGSSTSDDIRFCFSLLFPSLTTLLSDKIVWKDGIDGLMQLFVLKEMITILQMRHSR